MKHKIFICSIIFTLALLTAARVEAIVPAGFVSFSGKLLQSNGKPLAYTEIEMVPISSKKQINDPRLLATTGVSGLFSFANIPAGKYTLSINFDEKPTDTSPYSTFFYPNAANRTEAEIFSIDAASKISGIVFRLPSKLERRKITGKVVGADGKPVADAFVSLKDVQYDDSSFDLSNKTDAAGTFKFDGFENRTYYITAIQFDKLPNNSAPPAKPIAYGKTKPFVLDANYSDFILRLKKLGEDDERLENNVGLLSGY